MCRLFGECYRLLAWVWVVLLVACGNRTDEPNSPDPFAPAGDDPVATGSSSRPTSVNSYTDLDHMLLSDCQGNRYPIVLIGEQYWMQTNLKCSQYDTESELPNVLLETTYDDSFYPGYVDGSQVSTPYSSALTSTHRSRLGLLYNWAAAMGYASEVEALSQQTKYSGVRQGICPNGWHLPNADEWFQLMSYVEYQTREDIVPVLKSTEGWYNQGNGNDLYAFSALPAGYSIEDKVQFVGFVGYFWSSTAVSSSNAYSLYFLYGGYHLADIDYYRPKYYGHSVRCVKN